MKSAAGATASGSVAGGVRAVAGLLPPDGGGTLVLVAGLAAPLCWVGTVRLPLGAAASGSVAGGVRVGGGVTSPAPDFIKGCKILHETDLLHFTTK